jgi:hypothetical protein
MSDGEILGIIVAALFAIALLGLLAYVSYWAIKTVLIMFSLPHSFWHTVAVWVVLSMIVGYKVNYNGGKK